MIYDDGVDEHRELLFVAEERRDIGHGRALDVHHGLTMTLDEYRRGKAFDERGRDFVGNHRSRLRVGYRLVIFFTSCVVRHPRAFSQWWSGSREPDGLAAEVDAGATGRRRFAPAEQLARTDLLVQGEDAVHQRLGTGRA